MLAPLTDFVGQCGQTKITKAKGTKKVPWHCEEVHQKAFNMVKTTIAKDVVLAYPDYNKVFEVYTDALSTQLGIGHWCYSVGNYPNPTKIQHELILNSWP